MERQTLRSGLHHLSWKIQDVALSGALQQEQMQPGSKRPSDFPSFPPCTPRCSLERSKAIQAVLPDPWCVLGGLCWCCLATGTSVFCVGKQLVKLGAKLIELKFSQLLISDLNQYQLIPKDGGVQSTCILLISFCVGSIQQTE